MCYLWQVAPDRHVHQLIRIGIIRLILRFDKRHASHNETFYYAVKNFEKIK